MYKGDNICFRMKGMQRTLSGGYGGRAGQVLMAGLVV